MLTRLFRVVHCNGTNSWGVEDVEGRKISKWILQIHDVDWIQLAQS
jgi:hypothetical protein